MEVLKQMVQKLEVQEPDLWREGLEGILVGHLGALGGGEGEGDLAILKEHIHCILHKILSSFHLGMPG